MSTAKKTPPKQEKAVVVKNRETKVLMLYPEQLQVNPKNKRFDYGNTDELAKSIVDGGIREPLRGKKLTTKTDDGWPMYELTDGHRRLRAAVKVADKMEEGDFVPFIVEPADYTDEQRVLDALTTGEHSKPLNLLEAARFVKELLDAKMKPSDIARKVGKSPTYITDCKILMEKGTEKMFAKIEAGQMTASSYVEMLKVNDTEKVDEIVEKELKKADKVAGKGKGKLKVSKLEEESGEALTTKGKKVVKGKKDKDAEPEEPKADKSLQKLLDLRTALKAQTTEIKIPESFDMLNALIKLCKGTAEPIDMIPLFFVQMTEETAEEEEAPKKKKKAAPVEEEPAPAKKKKAAPNVEEDEEEEPAPKKKPTKGAKPLNHKKKKAVEEDEEEEPIEDDLDLEPLEDDDDNEIE